MSFCIELQETLQPEVQHYSADVLLGVCWPQGLLPICPILQQVAVEVSKGTEQRLEDQGAQSNMKENVSMNHKNSLGMDRDIFKSNISAAKISHEEFKTEECKIKFNII